MLPVRERLTDRCLLGLLVVPVLGSSGCVNCLLPSKADAARHNSESVARCCTMCDARRAGCKRGAMMLWNVGGKNRQE